MVNLDPVKMSFELANVFLKIRSELAKVRIDLGSKLTLVQTKVRSEFTKDRIEVRSEMQSTIAKFTVRDVFFLSSISVDEAGCLPLM